MKRQEFRPVCGGCMDTLVLTIDEVALYDRQIRLWGMNAQNRWVIYKMVDDVLMKE